MKQHAVKLAALSALVAGGAVAALPAIAPAAAEHHHPKKGKTREVGVQSDFYDPAKLTIHVGDKVKWVWHASGFDLHDVYVDSGPTSSTRRPRRAGRSRRPSRRPGPTSSTAPSTKRT